MAKVKSKVITVTLELTEKEAAVLVELAYKIGGSLDGPRGRMDSIREALQGVGIERCGDSNSGAVRFD